MEKLLEQKVIQNVEYLSINIQTNERKKTKQFSNNMQTNGKTIFGEL